MQIGSEVSFISSHHLSQEQPIAQDNISGASSATWRLEKRTGEVVVRSISTGEGHTEYTPIGHTANLASRLQTLAPVGSVAVTEATRKLVRETFLRTTHSSGQKLAATYIGCAGESVKSASEKKET